MIADLKPYAEYKESGLPWLGQVPGHWEVRRMKLLLREVDARSTAGKEQLLRVSQYTGVTRRKSVDGSDVPDTRASSLVGYKRVMPSDLVINIMLAWNGSMGVSRYDGIASPAYCVYRFKPGAIPWYYHELLRLPVYKGRIKTASTGVVESRLRLYSDDLGRIEVIQPPLVEQAAIVRFLDWANGRLERAIRAKRKVIALLNEQKQAIIHRAVTRGLDPSVPLKPSGIPWLGEIPQHWDVIPLKRTCSLVRSLRHAFAAGSDADRLSSLERQEHGGRPPCSKARRQFHLEDGLRHAEPIVRRATPRRVDGNRGRDAREGCSCGRHRPLPTPA
jgi:type I restriction enzyme S subunit